MRVYSNTDIGMIRDLNEDYYDNIIEENWALLIVADGMGGHKAGEVASMMAVEGIKNFIYENTSRITNRLELLEKAIEENIWFSHQFGRLQQYGNNGCLGFY